MYPVRTVIADEFENRPAWVSLEQQVEAIRNRAHELSMGRWWSDPGLELKDWLTAERELFRQPAAELRETDQEFRLLVAVPGLDPARMEVSAEPERVAIRVVAPPETLHNDERVVFSDFDEREVFRVVELDHPIDPAAVEASVENGMLTVVLPKAPIALLTPHEESAVLVSV